MGLNDVWMSMLPFSLGVLLVVFSYVISHTFISMDPTTAHL